MNDIKILIENMENKLDQAAHLTDGAEFWCIHETQQLLEELKLKLGNNKMFEEVLMVEFPITDYMHLDHSQKNEIVKDLTFNLKLRDPKFCFSIDSIDSHDGIFQAYIPVTVLNDADLLDAEGYTKEDFKKIFN